MDKGFADFEDQAVQAVDSGRVPGVVAVASAPGTSYSFSRPSPVVEADHGPDTVMWLASMSKLVTTVATLRLVDAGIVDLDEPVDCVDYLHRVAVLIGYNRHGEVLETRSRAITPRMLLTHTAGFGYDFLNRDLARFVRDHRVPARPTGRAEALTLPLIAHPGQAWNYGTNTDFLGVFLECRTGRRLQDVLATEVCVPLGITSIGFGPRGPAAPIYTRDPAGSLESLPLVYPDDPETPSAGGGLYGTPADFLRLLSAVATNDTGGAGENRDLLAAETWAELFRPQLPAGWVRPVKTAQPHQSHDWDFIPAQGDNWNLAGLTSHSAGPHGRSPGSLMWAGLCNSYFYVDPVRAEAAAVFTQLLPFADPEMLRLFDVLEVDMRAQAAG